MDLTLVRRARGAARDRRGVRPRGGRAGHRRALRARRVPVRDRARRWARWACSACPFPEEYGGMGGDYFALCLALEELARVDSSVAITLEAGVSLGAMPIYRFGTEEQKREWLPRAAPGEALGAFGLTEPGGGSDAGRHPHHRAARRRRVGDQRHQGVHHQLRHRHHRAGHGHRGHRRRGADGRKEISAIIVPAGTPGFTVVAEVLQGRLERLRHPRAVLRRRAACPPPTCSASAAAATRSSCSILDEGRIAIAALAVGLAQGCVDESVRYAHERAGVRPADRRLPGHPVQDRRHGGAGAHRPAGLLRRGRADAAPGEPFKKEAAIAKLYASRSRRWTTPARPPRSTAATAS